MAKSYDDQGFLITPTPAPTPDVPSATDPTILSIQTIKPGNAQEDNIVSHATAANNAMQSNLSEIFWYAVAITLGMQVFL